ncbi:helical backbone metal receptor [Rhodohalobacter mucosus]|uniref:helical backbone metal receptor n=1 Tax=Rhodohalobacter mucosus TaxID=2079485 RepID=UPI001FA8AD87|nr:helical backbone metal receptor [Rhodohalobacter mucosus]
MPTNRIISLVPSLTELLFDLGLDDSVAGRTRFCIHPEKRIDNVPIIGGTKNPRIERIRELEPDLVIANREENRKEDVKAIEEFCEVMVTDINTIDDALFAIHDIGDRCGTKEKAAELIDAVRKELHHVPEEPLLRAAYIVWREPWMSVGNDTYIHSVMMHWKLENVFSNRTRYPKTTLDELNKVQPDVILLSSEPYPFREKHLEEVSSRCKDSRVLLVDGEWFSWYGSRMLPAFRKLNAFRKAIG